MSRLQRWIAAHEDDPRAYTPKAQAALAVRQQFSGDYGRRAAEAKLRAANEEHEANLRRARAVAVGLAAITDKIRSDPLYTARQASHDADVLRSEYVRLRAALPALAAKVEEARAISADPVMWAENYFERFPLLAERLPGLPGF